MKKSRYQDDSHSSLFVQTWTNPKHSKSQVNGQTMQTQSGVILEAQTKKRH
ncbi:MAG: YpzG family protein [Bacilli bacterium]